MKIKGSVLLYLATGLLLVACHNNSSPGIREQDNNTTKSAKAGSIVFDKPVLIFIKSDTKAFNPEATLYKAFLFRAQGLGIQTAVMPSVDLEFIFKSKKRSLLPAASLSEGAMVLFNGSGVMITYPDEASTDSFDSFYDVLSGKSKRLNLAVNSNSKHNKSKAKNAIPDSETIISGDLSHITPSPPVTNELSYKASVLNRTANVPSNDEPGQLKPVIVRNPVQQSYISNARGLIIRFDNDLFSNTDRYYTNGVDIACYSPSIAFWRINNVLPVSVKQSMEYNMLHLRHEMYTPFTTKVPPLLEGDRPYASALYLRFRRVAEKPGEGIIQDASFDIGVIGKAALGSILQKGVHAGLPTNDEPLGWETQISNDIVLNYNYRLTRQLMSTGNFFSYSTVAGSLGTLYTSIESGIGFKIGTDRYFLIPLPDDFNKLNNTSLSKWRFSFESNLTTRVVGHNATLTGGLLNKNNIYVLKPEEIERLIFTADARIAINYSRYGISIAQYFITKEFNEGKSHFWGQIGINIGF